MDFAMILGHGVAHDRYFTLAVTLKPFTGERMTHRLSYDRGVHQP